MTPCNTLRKMAELERNIEKYFRAEIRARGGWAIKMLGVAGLPDRLVLMPGARVFFVELKTTTGRVSKIQKVVHGRLEKLGFEVWVLKGKDQVREWLNDFA